MKAHQDAEPRLYRTGQQAWLVAVLGCLFLAVPVASIVQEFGRHDVAPGRRALAVGFLVGLIAVDAGITLWRAPRAGVKVTDDGVTIRNLFRSRRPGWDEIDRFSVEPYGVWTGGCVHLRDGTSLRTWGIQGQTPTLFRNGRWADGPIERLNELLLEAQGSDNGPDRAPSAGSSRSPA